MTDDKMLKRNGLPPPPDPCNCYQNDYIDLVVEGASIRLGRLSNLSVPGELSAYIPRVEIRQKYYENGELVREDERIYNSITVVHAPRHPLENPPEIPTVKSESLLIEEPPPPDVPIAPGLDQPETVKPPVIPSQPESHPPPVAPREGSLNFPTRAVRETSTEALPIITINKRQI